MKKIMNIMKVCMAVLLAAGLFSACTKDDPEEGKENVMTITGLSTGDITTALGSCSVYIESGYDGICFYPYDTHGNFIADIECAYSHKGESIDLTKEDSCQNDNDQYSFYVEIPCGTEEFFLWGGNEDDSSRADKGYLKFDENKGVYTLELDAEYDGVHVNLYYKGTITELDDHLEFDEY